MKFDASSVNQLKKSFSQYNHNTASPNADYTTLSMNDIFHLSELINSAECIYSKERKE